MQEASPLMGLGMQLAMTMVFFIAGGYFLDQWLGTTPWLLLAGAVLGIVMFFVHLFRIVQELNQKTKARPKKDRSEESPPPTS